MGVNIKEAAQKTFNKHIDAAVVAVSNGDLFDQDPESCPRRFLADSVSGIPLQLGDVINLELVGDVLIGTKGTLKVLQTEHAPPEVIEHIHARSGIASGRVANLNSLSGLVEVDLC